MRRFAILRRRRRLSQFDELEVTAARGRNPEQQAIDAELRMALAQALSMLPEPYRIVFTLREIEEISTTDAAGMSGDQRRMRAHPFAPCPRPAAAAVGETSRQFKPSPRCRRRPVA